MAEYQDLTQALTWLLTNRIQQKITYTHGLLGDGNGRVRVTSSPNSPDVDFVYVRPDRLSDRTFKIFNKRIEGQDGDPIIFGELPWEPDLVQVIDMDWAAYADVGWGDDISTTQRHGISHQWRDGAPGMDTFNVYRRQFGDLKTYSTESGTLGVGVSPYSLDIYGTQYQWPGTQSFSLQGALPAGTGTARMALVYWSSASGTTQGYLGVASGTLGSSSDATILNRPVTPEGAIPSAFVRLKGGQTSVSEFDIWDAREPFRPGILFGTGTSGLSADKIPISDNFGLYTGSTVEAALDQIGFDGGRVSKVYESDFENVVLSVDGVGQTTIQPAVDSATAVQVLDADGGDPVLNIDTTNEAVSVRTATNQYTFQATSTQGQLFVQDADVGGVRTLVLSRSSDTAARGGQSAYLRARAGAAAVQDGDAIGSFNFEAHDGTDYNLAAQFGAVIDGSVAANTVPMAFFIKTSATNNAGATERVRVMPGGNVGISEDDPKFKLHVTDGPGTMPAAPSGNGIIIQNNDTTTDNARLTIIAGATGNSILDFGDSSAAGDGQFLYNHSARAMRFTVAGTGNRVTINSSGDTGINRPDTTVTAQLHVDQNEDDGAQPVLLLDQADVSEEMIEFVSTIGTGNAIEAVGAKVLTTTHFIKVTLPGSLTRYIPVGTIA